MTKRRGNVGKVILIVIIAITAVLLLIYLGLAIYFKSHYFWHTTVGSVSCGGKTAKYVEDRNIQNAEDYLLTIYGRDDSKYHINGSDFDYKYSPTGEEADILANQNIFLWPSCISGSFQHNLEASATYDEATLEKLIKESDLFYEENQVAPENAYIQMTDDSYEVINEIPGNTLVFDKVLPVITEAVNNQESTLLLEDDCYLNPEITTNSKVITECESKIAGYLAAEITYDIENAEEKLTSAEIHKMISVDEDCNVTLDEDAVAKYVQYMASTFNTYGDKREFKTSLGDTITVGGGDYGWVISKSGEKEQILKDLEAGKPVNREPVYEQTAWGPYDNDLGDTYLELDYSNQHYYYYVKGELKLDADIVSGTMSNGMGSPDGFFKIIYCEKNATLVGENYSTPVDYFMPFAYNVGFHDAGWRGAFGGEIYINSGSHGCINMNPADAKALFDLVEVGTPVVAYYRTPVALTSESAEIGNAFSYVAPETTAPEGTQ